MQGIRVVIQLSLVLLTTLLSPTFVAGSPSQDVLHLALGDDERSRYEVSLGLDAITDTVARF